MRHRCCCILGELALQVLSVASAQSDDLGDSMAKGKKCSQCGFPMFAEREQVEAQGTTVWYACQNHQKPCNNKEKVFEPK